MQKAVTQIQELNTRLLALTKENNSLKSQLYQAADDIYTKVDEKHTQLLIQQVNGLLQNVTGFISAGEVLQQGLQASKQLKEYEERIMDEINKINQQIQELDNTSIKKEDIYYLDAQVNKVLKEADVYSNDILASQITLQQLYKKIQSMDWQTDSDLQNLMAQFEAQKSNLETQKQKIADWQSSKMKDNQEKTDGKKRKTNLQQ